MNNISIGKKLVDDINKKMNKNTYMDNYGGSVIITVLIGLATLVLISRLYLMKYAEPIKQNWTNERCKPHVLPFAGLIMKSKNPSKFTSDNFTSCTTNILSNITQHFLQPVYNITNYLMEAINEIGDSFNYLRKYKLNLRNKLGSIFSYIFARILNVTIPLQKIMIELKDTLKKTVGVLTSAIFTMIGIKWLLKVLLRFLYLCLLYL